ncbi:uncharacterized protein LOC113684647, partial [Pocillopora damicornis]|uniref:uncharacterized protein LOC113684647 n=1 Tax=Pocillopora damicornis TaxID=46731 RepID=UPI000F54D127
YGCDCFILQFNIRGFTLHRKELYTSLSLLLVTLLFGALVNDFVAIIDVEMPENSTHEFTFVILLLHCVSFTLSILGFVYNSLAEKSIGTIVGQILVAFNMGLFVCRIFLELVFLEFRPEEMATTT